MERLVCKWPSRGCHCHAPAGGHPWGWSTGAQYLPVNGTRWSNLRSDMPGGVVVYNSDNVATPSGTDRLLGGRNIQKGDRGFLPEATVDYAPGSKEDRNCGGVPRHPL